MNIIQYSVINNRIGDNMVHKDDLNWKYMVENMGIIQIETTLKRIRLIMRELSDLSCEEIDLIISIGGLNCGGLEHLQSRCFNHSLGYLIDLREYENYHLTELSNCLNLLEYGFSSNKKPKKPSDHINEIREIRDKW